MKKYRKTQTTKPHIERLLRVAFYKVELSCGHSFESSSEDADHDKLFIGKSVQCGKCLDLETEVLERRPSVA